VAVVLTLHNYNKKHTISTTKNIQLLVQIKQTKLQWLQNSSQINVNNVNNARRETSRTNKGISERQSQGPWNKQKEQQYLRHGVN
jgi:hypothetical protein